VKFISETEKIEAMKTVIFEGESPPSAGTACWAPVCASSCQPTFKDKALSFALLYFA